MSIRIGNQIISGGAGGGNGDSLTNQNLSSDITQVYNWVGTYADYVEQDVANTHPDWVCYITDDEFGEDEELQIYQITARNVGDIFFTSRTDEWLNGAVECDGSEYNISEYEGEESIGNLLKSGKIAYVSYTYYNMLLNANGSVGCFAWDGEGTDKFRVPTLNDIFVESGKANQIGQFVGAGLPNISGNVTFYGVEAWNGGGDGAFKVNVASNTSTSHHSGGSEKIPTLTFDASRSSSVYGNSSTVQPNAVRYRAMVQIYTGYNDEAIDTCRAAKEDISKIKSTVSNCITKIPQDIKLELVDENTITLKAGSVVYVPNGFEIDGTTLKFDRIVITQDISVNVGTIVPTASLFEQLHVNYIPSLNAIVTASYVNSSQSGTGTVPTFSENPWSLYYKVDTNKLYNVQRDGTPEVSFPLAIITREAIANDRYYFRSINQVYNGMGYVGKHVFVLPGIEGLIPNGRNSDGSLKNIEYTNDRVIVCDATENERSTRQDFMLGIGNVINLGYESGVKNILHWGRSDGNVRYLEFLPSKSPKTYVRAYIESENKWYHAYGDESLNWLSRDNTDEFFEIASYDLKDGKISAFYPKSVIHAKNEQDTGDYVVSYMSPTADNGYIWCRVWKSGWVEQGGTSATICGTTVTLPIAMADTNYTAVSTVVAYTNNNAMGADISKITRTATTIKLGDFANWNGVSFVWRVEGYAA